MKRQALANIEKALIDIIKMARAGYQAAESIETQLNWCKSYLNGLPTTKRPGPFSMGLIATREFDMYGDDPALASLINEIQNYVESELEKEKP
jgi:hypothetical protein